jgi:hypothetical protein
MRGGRIACSVREPELSLPEPMRSNAVSSVSESWDCPRGDSKGKNQE